MTDVDNDNNEKEPEEMIPFLVFLLHLELFDQLFCLWTLQLVLLMPKCHYLGGHVFKVKGTVKSPAVTSLSPIL
jgi:hypothetical protein